MKKVAVIGAGTMGNGICHVFAQRGFQVALIDVSADAHEKAKNTIATNLDRMIKKGTISEDDKLATLSNITTYTSLAEGASDVDLLVEAATERLDLKLKIFTEADQIVPERAILASNTSSISITKIASATKRPDKVIGMHF
ncbi:MAG TPA: 3-hydroxyacyl-CoA dehydrogenase NAD-binding domain-containing protein, partial [Saprospiraceae bacterium]|nr:3-hydroxyacyl-CoA dehydrogenase NAD-binding domain-containing protein [Saprospiraceae bacterium]